MTRSKPGRKTRLLGAGLLAAIALSGCASGPQTSGTQSSGTESSSAVPASPGQSQSPPAADLASFYAQRLDWAACGENQCAKLTVPVDYANPTGATLELAVLRVRSTGDPQGTIVVDPGGPGASGVDYAAAAPYIATGNLIDHFDIVGFDPRGVSRSAPIDCLTDSQLDAFIDADATPDDSAEVDAIVAMSDAFARGCTAPVEGLLQHMATADSARDMDVLRAALGEDKLDYLGVSYGTHLGATYAALFPANVGRLVLDGPLPAQLSAEELTLGQAQGFEDALRRFTADCLRQESCPLGAHVDDPQASDVDAALATLTAKLKSLDATPMSTDEANRPLTEGAAMYGILMAMYSPDSDWPQLRDALSALFTGNGNPLQQFLDRRMQRRVDGTYADNSSEAFYAVSCVDRPVSGGAAEAASLSREWTTKAPVVGPYLAWGNLPCVNWPDPVVAPSLPTAALPTILVVATTHDPATPLPWGQLLVTQLGNAELLIREGDGHTAYREGSECIDSAIDAFFIDGTLPPSGTTCH